MIHSCAGGVEKDKKFYDFAKVEIVDTAEVRWYVCTLPLVQVGDFVLVPYGKDNVEKKARVMRLDKHVSEQVSPLPIRQIKEIVGLCMD